MKVKNESEVAQSCMTLSDPMDCSLPGSSIHGIFQARVLELGTVLSEGIYMDIDISIRFIFNFIERLNLSPIKMMGKNILDKKNLKEEIGEFCGEKYKYDLNIYSAT